MNPLLIASCVALIYILTRSDSSNAAAYSPEKSSGKGKNKMFQLTLPKKNLFFFGNPDSKIRIALRAGHSIFNDGARGGNMSENPYAFDIARRIAEKLSPFAYVMVTRRDYRKQYGAETRTVNKFNPVADIQIHLNHSKSIKARGTLTMYYKNSKKGGFKLAKMLTAAVRKAIGSKTTYSEDGTVGLPSEGFQNIAFMVRNPKPVSVIMELFFVSSPADRELADENHEKSALADEVAAALLKFAKEGA